MRQRVERTDPHAPDRIARRELRDDAARSTAERRDDTGVHPEELRHGVDRRGPSVWHVGQAETQGNVQNRLGYGGLSTVVQPSADAPEHLIAPRGACGEQRGLSDGGAAIRLFTRW